MSDEIRKVVNVIADAMPADPESYALDPDGSHKRDNARDILTALHAAGYEIVPGWSDDLGKAPRDTEVLVYDREGNVFVALWDSNTGLWHETVELQELRGLTHWKPIIPPKESGE